MLWLVVARSVARGAAAPPLSPELEAALELHRRTVAAAGVVADADVGATLERLRAMLARLGEMAEALRVIAALKAEIAE